MTNDRVDRARATRWLIDELPRAAVAWLPTMRWYGGKSRPIASVAVEEVLWFEGGPPEAALVVLDVVSGNPRLDFPSEHDRYAAVVAFVVDPEGRPLLGTLPGAPPWHAIEATPDAGSVAALLRGLATGSTVQGLRGGEIVYADAADGVRQLLAKGAAALPIAPMGSEQSNTSVRVGCAHVFKLFRRLEAGEHPQLEVGRFLTRVGFRSAAPLEGSLSYRSGTGQVHALGTLEGWITSSGDGWTYVTSQLRRRDRAVHHQAIAEQVYGLGETTAAFHLALASDATTPAFAPEPVTEADVSAWLAGLDQQADRTRGLVERLHHEWTDRDATTARGFLEVLRDSLPRLGAGRHGLDLDFHKIRIHGDYHLGQTLKAVDGFALIDFEGEPSKPLAERRLKQSALKDVAGMLRSLDYAWATASAPETSRDPEVLGALAEARAAFLDGYLARARRDSATFLPAPDDLPRWTALFELEKALYEVEYEVNHRPAWVGIPLGASVRLLRDWQHA